MGEKIDDLQPFDNHSFVSALFEGVGKNRNKDDEEVSDDDETGEEENDD